MDLKDLRFFGIMGESFRNIFRFKTTFFVITVALLLPLSAMNLAHSKYAELLFSKIIKNQDLGSYYNEGNGGYGELSVVGARFGWISLWLSKVVYFAFYLVLSLVPTSAVVRTIFAIYGDGYASFRNAMSTVPKVLKRLLATFLWSLFIYLVFHLIFFGIFFVWFKYIWITTAGIVLIVFILVLYIVTLSYMIMIWQLANVVTILEDVCGRKALSKGETLMKGKKLAYGACFLVILLCLAGIHFVFEIWVVISISSQSLGTGFKILLGISCLVLLSMVELLRLANHTVVYFVCKSKHQEDIHLPTYLQGYGKSIIPLQQLNV